MPRLFADTSAIIKLYKTEPNSAAVRAVVPATAEIVVSPTLALEFRSAFAILERMGIVTPVDAITHVTTFTYHRAAYVEVPVSNAIISMAESLEERYGVSHGLRALDAIQLASAITAHSDQPLDAIVSTDDVQRAIAAAEGLIVLPETGDSHELTRHLSTQERWLLRLRTDSAKLSYWTLTIGN